MSQINLSQMGEFGLIDLIRKKASKASGVIRGIGDDTAVVAYTKEKHLLLTTDMLLEDVHFTFKMPPRWIGHKALACNISDIAAMGGLPQYALVSLGVNAKTPVKYIQDIYQGIFDLAEKFNVSIVGGDTVQSKKLIINIALTGEVQKRHLVTRAGAKAGDQIFVTGSLGRSFQTQHHLKFIPRIKESQFLVQNFHPTSMIDISDGLASDLGHVLEESQQGALLYEKRIPRRSQATLSQALSDGEDFELLFTASSKDAERLKKRVKGMSFYQIGEIVSSKVLSMVDRFGRTKIIQSKGYKHF
jgi:thiamine-monophosphate kinase